MSNSYLNNQIKYFEQLYNKDPYNSFVKQQLDLYKSLLQHDEQLTASSDDEETPTEQNEQSNTPQLSEKAQMLNFIQHNDIKQIQQQLLTDYVKTLPLNEHFDAFYLLTGFNDYIKTLDKYKEQHKYNVLSLRSTIILGKMLNKIDCIK